MAPLLLLIGLACSVVAKGETAIRGLNPELASHYRGTGGTFTCISGVAKIIPFSRVNDDYCDCPDGSDEPGTAACHNGRFYCRNLGHEPKLLAAAFVDDGVCDCCDGADEPKGKCRNTCLEASAVHREALKGKIAEYERALATKAEYVAKAQAYKQELQAKAGTIDIDIANQEWEVERAREEVTRLEKEDEERRKSEQAALDASRAAADAAVTENSAAGAAQPTPEELSVIQADSGSQGGERLLHEEQQDQREETPEERGRRIASQWTHDPEAAGPTPGSEDGVRGNADGEDAEDAAQDDQGTQDYNHNQDGEYNNDHHVDDTVHHAYGDQPVHQARRRLNEVTHKLDELKRVKEDIALFLHGTLDLGPSDIFLAFHGECFTSYQTRFNYEMCFFKQATQMEGYSNRVNVGKWSGFSADHKQILYTGGDECWQVGPRSFTVSMSCGNDNQLSDGEEPATCAYTAKFQTPAQCSDEELQGLRDQLANLEALEQQIRHQLAKDEL